MQLPNHRIVAGTLALIGAAALPIIACGTDDSATGGGGSGTDGGGPVVVSPDGGTIPASCIDGTKNNDETDVDCGGSCNKCADAKSCATGADCTDGVCKDTGSGLKCQAPTTTDGVKNGIETGIDCGGMGNPKCADTQGCALGSDCTSGVCTAGTCAVPGPKDGAQNGDETDVDCGGTSNNLCADALKCKVDADCKSDVCVDKMDGKGLRCQAPTYTDGKVNGAETDIDCGGDPLHPCDTGKTCAVGGDCSTLGCNYKKKCAAGRSCTNPGGYGADTCGYGGDGPGQYALDKNWEDCCTKAPVVPTSGATSGKTINLDKYEVTAGRMRVFLEATGYNVRQFVQDARAAGKIPAVPGNVDSLSVLESAWDLYLPTSFAGNTNAGEIADCDQGGATTLSSTECDLAKGPLQQGLYTSVKNHLGGRIFKGNNQTSTGCFVGTDTTGGGTHAFRFPDGKQDGTGIPGFDQNTYDQKGMNCVDYLVGQAFCVWDGGRLELGQEQIAAWGTAAMPWAADTTQVPAAPVDRQAKYADGTPATCIAGSSTAQIDLQCDPTGTVKGAYQCPATGNSANKCVLRSGDKTYYGCRFPWATDATKCGNLTWPDTTSIEYADYQYSYEYPSEAMLPAGGNKYDYIRFISAPGRTRGRGPAGHADIIGNTFALTSNVAFAKNPDGTPNLDPQVVTHGWSSNGSWEVHNYSKPTAGTTNNSGLLNKYGKLGLRCAYTP